MRFLTHTWRLSLALAALVALLIAGYMIMVGRDFEAEKTATVRASQRLQVRAAAKAFERLTEQALFDARAVMAGYNHKHGELSPATQRVFWENANLLAIEYTHPPAHIHLEKLPGFLEQARGIEPGNAKPRVQALGDDRFVVAVQEAGGPTWRVVFESHDLLPATLNGQVLALSQRGRLLKRTADKELADEALRTYLKRKKRESIETRRIDGHRYLISSARLGTSDVLIAALTPLPQPVGGLFARALLFLAFAFFFAIALLAFLSRRMQADFTLEMQGETALRIQQTAEQTRRESEEKSAALLSQNVYPRQSFYRSASVRLAGPSSSEQGGQWWYYFQRDWELFIFSASTTEGLSPILLPASRALFSHLQRENLSLKEMARLWDQAIYDCSKGKATMKAQLLQINVELGHGRCINAAGGPILLFNPGENGFNGRTLPMEEGFSLGELKGLYLESEFELQAGQRLLLGTRTTSPAAAQQALFAHRAPNEWLEALAAKESLVAVDFKATRF
ncbi:MAG: SpoIIE family protein phosphatase [Bdellovibrionales bacterium]|nr:SpoIIE family protein phosphatase [Bdellovibrionales bacterium]